MKNMRPNSSNSKVLVKRVENLISRKKDNSTSMKTEIEDMLYELQAQNEELRRSQQQAELLKTKYQELFNLAPVAYFSFDTDFLIREANKTAEKLLKKKRSMLIRYPFVTLVSPLYLNLFYSHRLKVLSTKKKQSCELKIRRGDGREFYSLLESVPIVNHERQIIEIHSTCSDITERRQIELKKQAKLIQTSVENMLDPFAILRAVKEKSGNFKDFIFEYVNEAACKSNRKTKEETIGRSLLELYPGFKTNGLFEEYCRVFKTGKPSALKTIYMEPLNDEHSFNGIFDLRISKLNSGVVVTWRDVTEKIKAEERISYQAQLLENVSDAIIVTDRTFNITSWNKTAEKIFGWKVEKVIGENIFELGYRLSEPADFEEKLKYLQEKGYISTQEVYYRKDNSRIILDSVIIANYDQSGNIKGYIGIIRDITDKVKAEQHLLQEKKRLEILAEIAEVFTNVTADFSIVTEYTTQKLGNAYGDLCVINLVTEDKTELKNVAYFHPDKEAQEFLTEMFETDPIKTGEGIIGRVVNSEKTILIPKIEKVSDVPELKPGYLKYVDAFGLTSFVGVPIVDHGNVIGAISLLSSKKEEPYTVEDQVLLQNVANKISLALAGNKLFKEKLNEIEERRLAQNALASQQQLLQSVLEAIPVGVWIVDKNSNRVLCNEAVNKIWEDNGAEGLKDPARYTAWRAETGQCIELYCWAAEKALSGEMLLNEEVLIQCFDGTYKTILNSIVPIKTDGQIQDAIIVNVDITDRKNYEVRLQQTLDELERSNRELEQFAYIASHDLQEPLRMVSSYTQLLEKQYKEKLDPRAIEYISFAVQGAKRMQALIVDLLKYARVTTRAQAFEPVDCNDILTEVISDLKMAIEESNAEVINDSLPEIYADPTQIRQLLQNLIGNAIKFHSKNKPLIRISAEARKGEWLFSIRDNGIGIDARHFERIFMLFQRLHERDKYSGTGIGLAVCKKIVERHGGSIWVESEVNKGTKMLFTIPIRENNKV